MAKNRIIGVRVDEEQSEQFERAAKVVGKKVSDWLRDLGAAEVAPPKIVTSGWSEPPSFSGYEGVTIEAPHPVVVLEHAARAEAPIGRSVTEFLMTNAAKIVPASSSLESTEADDDPYEKRCRAEFGRKALGQAAGDKPGVRGWAKMNWQQRYEVLKEIESRASEWA